MTTETHTGLTATPLTTTGKTAPKAEEPSLWGGDGFGADDFFDLINPLQHIPVVSSIYRAMTGDEINAGARLIGGGILGGIPGLVGSAANIVLEEATGADAGETVMSALKDIGTTTTPEISANETPAAPAVPLEDDEGQALLAIAQAQIVETQQPRTQETAAVTIPKLPNQPSTAATENAYTYTQTQSKFDKTLIKAASS